MDFTYSEEQEAVRELAGRIFTERVTHERLKEIEQAAAEEGPIDRPLWRELADAGLLGIALDEEYGGAGLDFVAACLVIEAAGRTAAYVPLIETTVYGAAPIAQFGTPAQRQAWLPGVSSGDTILTAALAELVGEVILPGGTSPATTAQQPQPDGSWVLEGTKACVPAAFVANAILVPATRIGPDGTAAGSGVFIVDADADGLKMTKQTTTAGRLEAIIELSGVKVAADRQLGGDGADGAAIITAITELAADAYVDTEAVRLTAWQAASRLSDGLPASSEVAVAKFWAAEGGQRVVHAAAHLHGGVGVDRDYPLHRFFLLTRQIELTLGGANESLRRLGRALADEPV
jgi:3-oxocholest-4-en-26-oyl-CoA dehydrogenase beta subunit